MGSEDRPWTWRRKAAASVTDDQDEECSVFQRRARALGDPTRFRIFRCVVESTEPLGVAQLTEQLGLHHNAIRQHLAKLREAGLILEQRAPGNAPGRPRLEYRPAPRVAGMWGTRSPYELLSRLLLELHRGGRSPREVAAAAGRRLVLPQSSGDSLHHLEAEMARAGFEPRRVGDADSAEIVHERCPYEAVAATNPEVVCQLHLGLAEGIAEAAGAHVEVTQLVAYDPALAGCRLQTRTTTGTPRSPGEPDES